MADLFEEKFMLHMLTYLDLLILKLLEITGHIRPQLNTATRVNITQSFLYTWNNHLLSLKWLSTSCLSLFVQALNFEKQSLNCIIIWSNWNKCLGTSRTMCTYSSCQYDFMVLEGYSGRYFATVTMKFKYSQWQYIMYKFKVWHASLDF